MILKLTFGFIFLVVCSAPAMAAPVFSLETLPHTSGGTGTLVVVVTGSSDPIAAVDLELEVRPVGSVGSLLQFMQSTINIRNDPQYVFAGDSQSESLSIESGSISDNLSVSDTASWIDGTASLNDVLVSSRRLVAQFDFKHTFPLGTDPSQVADDEFEFTLNGSYADSSFAIGTIGPVSSSVVAIPEPQLATLLGLATLFGTVVADRRKRKRQLE